MTQKFKSNGKEEEKKENFSITYHRRQLKYNNEGHRECGMFEGQLRSTVLELHFEIL